jgi:hypothetical protein
LSFFNLYTDKFCTQSMMGLCELLFAWKIFML